jgi:parvulin-like peptidyl-prolyl isomerase
MPFTKDDKRINRNGRPKQRTQTNKELKELLTQMLQGYLDELNTQSDQLTLRDKLNFSRYILPYILPKLNNVTLTENQNSQFAPVEIDIKDLFRIGDFKPTKDEI